MDCLFCDAPVRFDQHKMAHRIFELSDVGSNWWLCRDCAEIRTRGDKTEGLAGERGTCIDCDETATYGIALLKKTPRGDVASDETVYHVLCDDHFDERKIDG